VQVRILACLLSLLLVVAISAPGCGARDALVAPTDDGAGAADGGGGSGNCQGDGLPCQNGDTCCSGVCEAGACKPAACLDDGAACSSGASCCSGSC